MIHRIVSTSHLHKVGFTDAALDTTTNQIDFGGVHMNYSTMDALAAETGLHDLELKFVHTRPQHNLGFVQRIGSELAPGGSGYQITPPKGGYTRGDMEKITAFLTRVDTMVGKLKAEQKKVADSADRSRSQN